MSFGNIIGSLLEQGMGGSAGRRLRTGVESADRSGGDRMLQSVLTRGRSAEGTDFSGMARDFLRQKQAGGMSGAQIGGLGALAGALFGGGGFKGAASGGAMAVLGTLALNAWRQHEAERSGKTLPAEATPDEAIALTDPQSERLVLHAMIGAAQADGRIDEAEIERILGRVDGDGVTEEERREAREAARQPVDVEALGAQVTRPELAAEVYLAALMAVEIDTEAEKDYLRRLARALRLDPAMVRRLHRMTGAPEA